jgi:hypothetical protein
VVIGTITAKVMKDKSVVVEMSGHLTGALIKGHVIRAIYLTYARNYKREYFKEAEKVREQLLKAAPASSAPQTGK